jgi:hypothetical protein
MASKNGVSRSASPAGTLLREYLLFGGNMNIMDMSWMRIMDKPLISLIPVEDVRE